MRKIAFRSWDTHQKIMLYKIEDTISGDLNTIVADVQGNNGSLMQATGYIDKNGKEVWEGDIVKWFFHDLEHESAPYYETGLAEVVWSDFHMGFRLQVTDFAPKGYEGADLFEFWEDPELWTIEVVGDTYTYKKIV